MGEPRIGVVVPTLNAQGEIGPLLDNLLGQTLRPSRVIVVDSSSDDATVGEASSRPGVEVRVIERADFNHGLTRGAALLESGCDFCCFLTQDAVPAGDLYLERLVGPMLRDDGVALVSGRQLPKPGARRFEELVRGFNYPSEPSVRDASDVGRLGIKAFFASDVCSAYRCSSVASCGGFPEVETNEDMLMAARLISAGLKVAYEPSAAVYHSHNLTPKEQFKRNKAVGRFLEMHGGELMGASEIGEGGRLVREVSAQLLSERRIAELAAFGVDCAARLLGNRAGRREAWKEMR